MKQIWPNYSYSPTTNVLTLTGLNIDRDQLLLVTAADRGRIMYNFADSSVTASAFTSGANTALTLVATTAGLTTTAALVIYYDDQVASNSVTVSSLPAISGTVTANLSNTVTATYKTAIGGVNAVPFIFAKEGAYGGEILGYDGANTSLNVNIKGSLPSLVAGTAQIGSVTASISGTVPVSGTFFQATQPVSLATVPTHGVTLASTTVTVSSLPEISGTVTASVSNFEVIASDVGGNAPVLGLQLGFSAGEEDYRIVDPTNPLPISGTVTANTFAVQGTAVTTSNFTSITPSTVLANFNATREVLTIFNEGAGNLHICAGATCTTIAYQVRLSAGDYYEVPNHQTSLTHSAVFATAGTARVTQVS